MKKVINKLITWYCNRNGYSFYPYWSTGYSVDYRNHKGWFMSRLYELGENQLVNKQMYDLVLEDKELLETRVLEWYFESNDPKFRDALAAINF